MCAISGGGAEPPAPPTPHHFRFKNFKYGKCFKRSKHFRHRLRRVGIDERESWQIWRDSSCGASYHGGDICEWYDLSEACSSGGITEISESSESPGWVEGGGVTRNPGANLRRWRWRCRHQRARRMVPPFGMPPHAPSR